MLKKKKKNRKMKSLNLNSMKNQQNRTLRMIQVNKLMHLLLVEVSLKMQMTMKIVNNLKTLEMKVTKTKKATNSTIMK